MSPYLSGTSRFSYRKPSQTRKRHHAARSFFPLRPSEDKGGAPLDSILFIFVLGAVSALTAYILIVSPSILLYLGGAAVISSFLSPLVRILAAQDLSRLAAAILLLVLAALVLIASFSILSPAIAKELSLFEAAQASERMPDSFAKITVEWLQLFPFFRIESIQNALSAQSKELLTMLLRAAESAMVQLFSSTATLPFVLVVSFFFLKDGGLLKRKVVSSLPNRYFEQVAIILERCTARLGSYLRRQVIVALAVAIVAGSAFYLIRAPFAVSMGIMAGIAWLTPVWGVVLAAGPPILISLAHVQSPLIIIIITVVFASIHLIDGVILSRFVQSHRIDIHSLGTIIVMVAGAALGGFWGLLLATPAAGALKIVMREINHGLKTISSRSN